MQTLKFILLLVSTVAFGQSKDTSIIPAFNIYDFSDSRFNIDSSGFHGIYKADTVYYDDDKIASIGHYAIAKNSKMSGIKFGIWTEYYQNGQIRSQGSYDMYSLLYYRSPTKTSRIENYHKVGLWTYYYENGQVKATGIYHVINSKFGTGIPNQHGKISVTTSKWEFFNPDGSKALDTQRQIADIRHNPNCD